MSCPIRTEGQENVCSACGIRWDFGDDRPECRPARSLPATWKPSPRAELAARLRRVLVSQTRGRPNAVAIGITPALARDILTELEAANVRDNAGGVSKCDDDGGSCGLGGFCDKCKNVQAPKVKS